MDGERRGREEERRRELIQRLLGPAVHKLNNSMAVVSGLTALLQQHELNPARLKHFESVATQAHEATALIRELGQLPQVRPVSAEELEDIGLDDVLARVRTLVEPLCRSLRVELDAPEAHASGTRRTVRAPATALAQELTTLAAELLPRERLSSTGSLLRLLVRDTPGFVQVELDYRARGESPDADEARLAEAVEWARRRAEAWGGELVRRDSGRVVWSLASSTVQPVDVEAQRSTTAARILVLETDAQLGSLIGDVLADVGHDVVVLSDPDGRELTEDRDWDLVLHDSASGRGALKAAGSRSTPVVRMCGYDAEVEPGELVLLKPFRPKELIECVRAALAAD